MTNKIAVEYTQKEMRRDLKCFTTKKKISWTQKKIVVQNNKKAVRLTEHGHQNDRIKSFLNSSFYKYKCIKLQKDRLADWLEKPDPIIYLQETQFRSKDTKNLNMKEWEKRILINSNQKRAGWDGCTEMSQDRF